MFEVKIEGTYSGTKFRFMKWDEAVTFVEFVLANGVYETSDRIDRLAVTIKEVCDE